MKLKIKIILFYVLNSEHQGDGHSTAGQYIGPSSARRRGKPLVGRGVRKQTVRSRGWHDTFPGRAVGQEPYLDHGPVPGRSPDQGPAPPEFLAQKISRRGESGHVGQRNKL